LVTERSAFVSTVVAVFDVLLALFGSSVAEETVAVLSIS